MASLADWIKSQTSDYGQLKEAYPNAIKFGSALKKGISQLIPSNEDFKSPEAMRDWSTAAALNAPMGLTFIGKNAANWNPAKAAEAEKMLNAGVDPAQVWKEHLIGRMPDKSLFSEISDKEANMLPLGEGGVSYAADKAISHNDLLNNYPDLSNLYFSKGNSTYYSPEMNHIKIEKVNTTSGDNPLADIAQSRLTGLAERLDNKNMLNDKRSNKLDTLYEAMYSKYPEIAPTSSFDKSSSLHELQHAIQDREGWARGGSPEQMKEEALAMLRRDVASGEIPSTEQAMAMLPMAQQNAYRRLTGEAQARATQDRMNMNMQQRRESYPLAGGKLSDIPLDQLINRYGGNSPSMSIKDVANKNLNAGLLEKYLSTGKLSPKEMDQYEANGLAMETPQLQRYNVQNAMVNPERQAYKETLNVPVYHGTNEDIPAMSVEGKGKTRGAGAFVGTNPIASETYVQAFQGGNILPLLLNDKGFLKVNGKGQYWNDISTDSLYHKKTPLTDILPLEKNDFTSTDELGSLAKDAEYKGITIKNLDDLGLNSHIFRAKEYLNNKYGIVPDETWSNVPENKFNEARNFMENQYKKQRSDVTAVNDPSLLRSRFAAFDPLRKNSSSLLASLLGATALANEYDKNKKLKAMR